MNAEKLNKKNKPLFFYKFVPFERKDILENGMIRFTPPKEFNDPFELQPTVTAYSQKYINLNDDERENIKLSADDYQYSMDRHNLLPEKRNLLNAKINKIGILSLSSNLNINPLITISMPEKDDPRTNLIMWAHYADSHNGFIIEFRENFIEEMDVQKVEYSDERDIITYEEVDNNDFEKIFFKKSEEWAYEQEYRALLNLNKADKVIDDNIHLFKFDKSKINSITFGCNMAKSRKKEITDLINRDKSYGRVQFNHARLNDTGYLLSFYYDDGRVTNRMEVDGKPLGICTIPMQQKLYS